VLWLGCSGEPTYQPPTSGPRGTVVVSSLCTTPARFHARINGMRTEGYGCNQTARWEVTAGAVELVVQVEEADFRVSPIRIQFDLPTDRCANFLLRQRNGYDLEFLGVAECP
jgi:hypothetical protein